MAEKRKRGQNFCIEEKDKLIKLLLQHKETILNKRTDGTTNDAKIKAWMSLTDTFNSSGNHYRTKDSLMKLWEKIKSEAKIYYNLQKRHINGTGGGPSTSKIDPILEQVSNILGRGCTGIIDVNDCDNDVENISQPHKVVCVGEGDLIEVNKVISLEDNDFMIPPMSVETEIETNENECKINTTPLWSKRRRPLHYSSRGNEKSEAVNTLCNSFKQVNKKKENIEDLKKQLLTEEIEFKRRLYELQLHAAHKEIEIKNEILLQIKGGGLALSNLLQQSRQNE